MLSNRRPVRRSRVQQPRHAPVQVVHGAVGASFAHGIDVVDVGEPHGPCFDEVLAQAVRTKAVVAGVAVECGIERRERHHVWLGGNDRLKRMARRKGEELVKVDREHPAVAHAGGAVDTVVDGEHLAPHPQEGVQALPGRRLRPSGTIDHPRHRHLRHVRQALEFRVGRAARRVDKRVLNAQTTVVLDVEVHSREPHMPKKRRHTHGGLGGVPQPLVGRLVADRAESDVHRGFAPRVSVSAGPKRAALGSIPAALHVDVHAVRTDGV
mmetsp:Transcript_1821/g.3861  ORF Transcript_1821/g.3861 Transcript_1821/m.3861 type:complete len:267 (+) Transcript_1821:260-1060(+)